METAILLSLVGVRCLLSNQWTNSVQNNLQKVLNLLKGIAILLISSESPLYCVKIHDCFRLMLCAFCMHAGLLSEGFTVGELNWSHIRNSFSGSPTEADNNEDIAVHSKTNLTEIVEECSKQEDEGTPDKEALDYSSLYNCVVYGLPHINLIVPST